MAARHSRLSVAPWPARTSAPESNPIITENLDLGGGCAAMYSYVYVQLHDLVHFVEMKQCNNGVQLNTSQLIRLVSCDV